MVAAFVSCLILTAVFFQIGKLALAMQCCWPRVSAVQFTLYMAINNAGGTAGTALVGYVRSHYAWNITFGLAAALVLVPIGVLGLMRLAAHQRQVDELENRHLEQEAAGLRVAV